MAYRHSTFQSFDARTAIPADVLGPCLWRAGAAVVEGGVSEGHTPPSRCRAMSTLRLPRPPEVPARRTPRPRRAPCRAVRPAASAHQQLPIPAPARRAPQPRLAGAVAVHAPPGPRLAGPVQPRVAPGRGEPVGAGREVQVRRYRAPAVRRVHLEKPGTTKTRGSRVEPAETRFEIGDQVVGVLQPDVDAQQERGLRPRDDGAGDGHPVVCDEALVSAP